MANALLARAAYRCRQVLQALRPRLDPAELAAATASLSVREARLFGAMELRDQRHALEVARRLRLSGCDDPRLIAAALLHDCGKGAVPVWLRVVKVLRPSVLQRLARATGRGWRASAYRLQHHGALGAEAARAAGSDPLTVRLIAGRVREPERPLLQHLLAADDAS